MPHVYNLLIKIGTGSNWKDALLEVLPKKKLNEGITEEKSKSEYQHDSHDEDPEKSHEEIREESSREAPVIN